MTVRARSRFRSLLILSLVTLPALAQPQLKYAPEAAKVTSWLRELPAAKPGKSFFGVLGGISAAHLGPGVQTVRTSGPAALYDNASTLQATQSAVQIRADYLHNLATAGITEFRDVQNVPWGLIEVSPGRYQYEVIDGVLSTVATVDGSYVGTVMPYASWELAAAGYPLTTSEMCQRLLTEDFFYLQRDGRMDRYRDEAAYLRFLERVVERYDGDGIDDAPDLKAPIKAWQIHNEPEGDQCGLFRNDVAAFVRLMQISAEVIHRSCSDCVVVNGGAGIPLFLENRNPVPGGVLFWRDYAAMGGASSIDVIAAHYNQGKDPDHGNIDDLEYQIRRLRELLGANKPVWLTEFGVFVGFGGNFSALPEAEAAAWYVRFYTAGLAAGATKFFSDAPAFVQIDGTVYLPYFVNKLLDAKLGGFTSAQKIAAGQYSFRVNGHDVYVLWSGVPASLRGTVNAVDMYGNRTSADASSLHPTEAAPLIVEPAVTRRRSVR